LVWRERGRADTSHAFEWRWQGVDELARDAADARDALHRQTCRAMGHSRQRSGGGCHRSGQLRSKRRRWRGGDHLRGYQWARRRLASRHVHSVLRSDGDAARNGGDHAGAQALRELQRGGTLAASFEADERRSVLALLALASLGAKLELKGGGSST
jgi:hypothetical protein